LAALLLSTGKVAGFLVSLGYFDFASWFPPHILKVNAHDHDAAHCFCDFLPMVVTLKMDPDPSCYPPKPLK
jgi:hypothetical protein